MDNAAQLESDNYLAGPDPAGHFQPMAGGWPVLPRTVVKSAGRALQILEFFDDVRREAHVVEISEALGYPQSSTSVLLRSLVTLGYLDYNPRGRTYLPSMRVRLLGNWISPQLFPSGRIMELVEELNAVTGDVVMLVARNRSHAQYIHVVQATTTLRVHLTPGLMRPLALSVAGLHFLSELGDTEIGKIVRSNNNEAAGKFPAVSLASVMERVGELRRNGYSYRPSQITQGATMFAMTLPRDLVDQPLVLATGSPGSDAGREQFVLGEARRLVAKHLRRPQ